MSKIKSILVICALGLLFYTRFVNLSWGLPHPMHPDERNMANAIQQMNCEIRISKFEIRNCLNPHFFAYGQFPLYLGYFLVMLMKFFDGDLAKPISFEEAVISLRFISAIASILNVLILMKVVELLISKSQFLISKQITNNKYQLTMLLVFTFSPFFIQFSHFGTTESLLMLLYSIIVYLSLKHLKGDLRSSKFYILTAVFSGLAIAIKISSLLFLAVPLTLMIYQVKNTLIARSISIWYLLALTLVFSILFSPHNFISFPEFLGSMKYESDVAIGIYRAFYTRQFEDTIPILFQIAKIFPYVLGLPSFIFFLLGFFFLPYKKHFNILRIAILSVFIPSAFLYAKWTRFVSPIFPIMLTVAILFLNLIYHQLLGKISNIKYQISKLHIKYQIFFIFICHFAFFILIVAFIVPGIAYLSIYQNPDVRFTASDWIFKNIPENSYLLFETANVVDIPVTNPKSETRNSKQIQNSNYQMNSFNFYDLDENQELPAELQEHLTKANYIFVPSRRIFENHYCEEKSEIRNPKSELNSKFQITNPKRVILSLFQNLSQEKCQYLRKKYPKLNDYYDKLFSGKLGFEKVAEFSSFPKIQLFGKTFLEFPDEEAEETWTVFDHPVIRIYKRIGLSQRGKLHF